MSQEMEQGLGWMNLLSYKALEEIPHWYLNGRWAGLEDPQLFHSHVWPFGGNGWNIGSAGPGSSPVVPSAQ